MRATLALAALFGASGAWAQGVRAIDFRNRVWDDTVLGTVRTRDGYYTGPDPSIYERFDVYGVAFGDLDGDGVDEAVVATGCGGLGIEPGRDTRVFALRHGRLSELARLDEIVPSDGHLLSLRIERGVVVEQRLATDLDGANARYTITHRRGLRDGRLVELAPATVTCAPHHPRCPLPSALPTSVYFGVGRTAITRALTVDAGGQFSTLDILLDARQPLDATAWCTGTELTALHVAAPDVAYPRAGLASIGRAHPAGGYRVSVRTPRPVGLCYVFLSAPWDDRDDSDR